MTPIEGGIPSEPDELGVDTAVGANPIPVAAVLSWMRGSCTSRDAEILFPRQQLLVLKRTAPEWLRLRNPDRLIFVWLYEPARSVRRPHRRDP
jgi:hypothetical protein